MAQINAREEVRTVKRHFDAGRLDEAVEVFRDGVRATPNQVEICNNLVNALNEKGEFEEAADYCLRAVRLRTRMQQSPLMNAKQFAADMEAVYRQMWQNWCSGTSERR
jgi:Flp pilus assembly protein TadD